MNNVRPFLVLAAFAFLPLTDCHAGDAAAPAQTLATTLATTATASSPASSDTHRTATETPKMPTSNAAIQPKVTAEQALLQVLELIRSSKTIADFTPERLKQITGQPIEWAKNGDQRYGFGASLTPQWNLGFGVDKSGERPRFELIFSSNASDASPSLTDICPVDFDQFNTALKSMGFHGQSVYDSPPHALPGQERPPHGRLMYESFDRPGLRVQVYPQREHAPTPETGMGRLCVKQVYIY